MRAAVLALAACGSPAAVVDAPAPDAPPLDAFALVTGRAHAIDFRNDSQHMPGAGDQPFSTATATLRQPDGTWAPLPLAADGSFSFAMPDARSYRVRITADTGVPTELQLGTPAIDYVLRYGFRYDRTPVPAGTTLNVTLPGAPATGTAFIESTGVWANYSRPAAAGNGAFTLDWTVIPGLLDATAGDRAYAVVLQSVGTAPQYSNLVSACSADVTMAAGANPFTCTLAAVPLDHCMHLHADFAGEYARVAAALPATINYPNQGWAWNIVAAPVPAQGPLANLVIAGQGFSTTPAMDVDRDQVMYAVPYAGHSPLLQMTVQRYRSIMATGATAAATLSVNTAHLVSAQADCTSVTAAHNTIAIAGVPALAGVPLATDNAKLTIDRASDIDLAWPIAAAGRADFWIVVVLQVKNSGGATVLAPVQRWYVTDTHVALDPALLAANTPYVVEVVAFQGFANSESGDFNTMSYPQAVYATSQQWSAIFEVAN